MVSLIFYFVLFFSFHTHVWSLSKSCWLCFKNMANSLCLHCHHPCLTWIMISPFLSLVSPPPVPEQEKRLLFCCTWVLFLNSHKAYLNSSFWSPFKCPLSQWVLLWPPWPKLQPPRPTMKFPNPPPCFVFLTSTSIILISYTLLSQYKLHEGRYICLFCSLPHLQCQGEMLGT